MAFVAKFASVKLLISLFMRMKYYLAFMMLFCMGVVAQSNQNVVMETEELVMTKDWDKTFPKSEKVNHSKVTFVNRFGITLAADVYVP